jgi:hypothetical protein
MPYDIMTLIFYELNLCLKTCLGVTCKMFYEILKEKHPEPISLYYNSIKGFDPISVSRLCRSSRMVFARLEQLCNWL